MTLGESFMQTKLLWTLTSAALVLSCSADRVEGADSISFELSGTCVKSRADAIFDRGYSYHSPRTYGQANCGKGTVVDVRGYMRTVQTNGGSGGVGGVSEPPPVPAGGFTGVALPTEVGATRIAWADTIPPTQAACESTWLAAYLIERQSNPDAWTVQDFKSSRGVWAGSCQVPFVDYSSADMPTNGDYRIAASARTQPTTPAPTRELTVVTRFR